MKKRISATSFLASCLVVTGIGAAQAASGYLPPVHHSGRIAYLSGGIGLEQSEAIKAEMSAYPLALTFAQKTGGINDYLADVPVRIANLAGQPILDTVSKGPFLLASIPAGRYQISATANGQTIRRSVDVGSTGHVHEVFLWQHTAS